MQPLPLSAFSASYLGLLLARPAVAQRLLVGLRMGQPSPPKARSRLGAFIAAAGVSAPNGEKRPMP